MKWFKEHLHLTWLFYMVVSFFIDMSIMYLLIPTNPSAIGNIAAYVWLMLTPFPVNIWMLRQKHRNWAWSLFGLWERYKLVYIYDPIHDVCIWVCQNTSGAVGICVIQPSIVTNKDVPVVYR